MSNPGSYVVLIACSQPTTIEVGALGDRSFRATTYAYVGSAFGPGGLSRVDRHRRVAAGDHDVRHWHIDYLLGTTGVGIEAVETYPNRDIECDLATVIEAAGCQPVPAFGASDCDCESHLFELAVDSVAAARSLLSECKKSISTID